MAKNEENLEDKCVHLEEYIKTNKELDESEANAFILLEQYYSAGCDKCKGYNKACQYYVNKYMRVR